MTLKEIRKQRHLSQFQVGVMTKTSPVTILGIEKYGYVPSQRVRERIAAGLGVDVSELFKESVNA